ncbi:hypothetical protein JTE90_006932 [Oedothorax gibbosus]|uniref:Uncharacterized protein n=1 Tax=Oedothorax gibbosus TaxID=931172 RepID=A0AAV6VNF4_9ARAC|nr:hypothetical protein JTE90_006932 [Oedothorax gibbosus]
MANSMGKVNNPSDTVKIRPHNVNWQPESDDSQVKQTKPRTANIDLSGGKGLDTALYAEKGTYLPSG